MHACMVQGECVGAGVCGCIGQGKAGLWRERTLAQAFAKPVILSMEVDVPPVHLLLHTSFTTFATARTASMSPLG